MATSRPGNQNGVPNGTVAPSGPSAQPPRYTRPFTLQEALPYTPFSSIGPFDCSEYTLVSSGILPTNRYSRADILPSPSIGSPAPSITDSISRQYFDLLNQEAESQPTTSKRLQQSLKQLHHLISQRSETTELYVPPN